MYWMRLGLCLAAIVGGSTILQAQAPPAPSGPQATAGASATPLTVDLPKALDLARAYNAQFLASIIATSLAREDKVQAKAALLPTVNDLTQYIYTQGNGTPSGVFVPNDGVHVYVEQATVHTDLFSPTKLAEYRKSIAAETKARASQDIAARGLATTVVQSYYAIIAAQRHLGNAQSSLAEAQRFLVITQQQERGGEVARADVLKAQLQFQQRQRDLADAGLASEKAKLALGVMLFPDINQPFRVVDDLRADAPVPAVDEVRAQASVSNPELRAAEAGVQQANFGVKSARGAYFPTLSLDYFYGIDANVFAIHGPEDRQNLGSMLQGTMTIPLWNWGATRSKVQQAELQKRQAQTDLTLAKRGVEADVRGASLEAEAARTQIDSLRSSLDVATESLRLTLLRYQAGESTAQEVSDTQSALAQARNAYDDGLVRYRIALANIETLTGRF